MRIWMANVFVIALGLALLWHFSMIAIYGRVSIGEPNTFVLVSEIVLVSGIVGFAVYNLIRMVKDERRR